ncbi:Daunorubicin/doxorubicin resistance ATP-binding protein DrrA [Moorella thermoacetica]|uniref:Daunorubicin/doxorubicin resistance ATP-binding protein DrrA n=1 Tax=Neomoorella thermoacetica TaxID=1525 RepID=A0A1D7XEI3_NEOTH|nr:ATP-binding cassette domain-containing protein [Moorella thermoacetica]AOQ25272.1 Daunorubicin/doxorubicin resistance ATP-binding protein DrrA [Moorella thermoacetica]OIQ09956.1 daunorubicin/doxorubicin resistance ATP-binding protein DrrA [Moorella thermoacetica]OIQ10656.1 daunorubicin/doxorubicin resistance ATP-binding protein DrrA [Moorella thermoacetica]OIQ59182.1 daunorubicin/doxorubicin resistance ATP-binding protein DrrA [Moorella thermoacetica]TYL11793.1 Daunorubicin/doxorubicin resi
MAVIEVRNLVKRFNDLEAVAGVTFNVEEGEIFGFLGPNGAGKSTTIKMLCTLLKPTAGRLTLAGFDVAREPDAVRRSIGLVFQDNSLDDRLTAEENLYLHGLLYGLNRAAIKERIVEVLAMVDLADRRRDIVRTFSGGMRRRLEIARGLLHHPRVLFLDEPTVGLDPQTRSAIWQHIHRLRREKNITIFMTTHYMDEAENCDRIAIIDHGRIQALDTPDNLKRQLGGDVVTLTTIDDSRLQQEIAGRYGVRVIKDEEGLRLQVSDGATFIPRVAADFGGQINSISLRRPTLDDVFLNLTGRAIREEKPSAASLMRLNRRHGRRRH